MQLEPQTQEWSTRALGAIESIQWPLVSGWFAILSQDAETQLTIRIDGYRPLPVRGSLMRTDVQDHLGTPGVAGFQINLGDALTDTRGQVLGVGLPDGTVVELTYGDHILDRSRISDSPLGTQRPGCLEGRDREALSLFTIGGLRRRLLRSGIDDAGDWRELVARLGFDNHGATTEQWAACLTDRGHSAQQVAAWLSIRGAKELTAYPVSPLSASFDEALATDKGRTPEHVLGWGAGVLGFPGIVDPDEGCRVTVSQPDPQRVAVAGLLHHRSGLGQNARNSLRALDQAGIHNCSFAFFPGSGGWNPLLSATPEGIHSLADHSVLLHLPIDRVIPSLAAQPGLLRTNRLIGYFMWETEVIPQSFRRALDVVDEIWTGTTFVAEAISAATATPVHVTGHIVDTTRTARVGRGSLGINEDAFVVHYACDANSTVARKNPNGAIDAFMQAFGGDPSAVFLLKVRNMQQVDALAASGDPHAQGLLERLRRYPSIRLIAGEHDHSYALGLIELADCFISLHRSEGYGYGIAEAMALGTPVIATDYSGSTDLATGRTALLVPYDETDVAPGEYFYWEPGMKWAEPDIDCAATSLQLVREGKLPDIRAAQDWVEQNASLEAVSARYRACLSAGSSAARF